MLNLSIEEQKQILGGRWKAVVYDPSGNVYATAYFSTDSAARDWVDENYPNCVANVYEV
ncbi:hypothetical protein BJV85_003916 [Clostridium acetobutylicum]|uniref:Uncharacterized protein n=1 Tax=Clostridium acetobutylicum (strain ATCC 824 / DSM 792 / JCM 1419 / IAM 19013 / LMG 5710 / NBRC 13948 / NRRL B-527 / VKM B-1787 / 2291 / W) TaxID=272562 RepID=Q97TM6_CLOAB|nr:MULTISPECIES: hypothetical protein [Clostridium]AAK76818.1 Hypothetical protein CA_P0072 [Clostridium acetobutylicum ATCC 824]ADZ22854.1 Conserved hypothetical protein [Clostridium acetobutylicum EA 2018]AEI34814.1 hypothetical protein SMB_P071 [Clostridium acetobutylicum DSM 1731]AWV82363.1 hypothetical protein DK921_19920 [Clostridium acetobutylicum]MBC2395794.1 hypothetical protein [Clostridium acetobutylicum]